MNYFEKLNGGGYAAPTLEVLDIAVEQGFASSPIYGGKNEMCITI